jgi:hypothetical protein
MFALDCVATSVSLLISLEVGLTNGNVAQRIGGSQQVVQRQFQRGCEVS